MKQYFKPKSLTWWGGIFAIGTGVVMFLQGDQSEALAYITGGLTAIGLRKAIDK